MKKILFAASECVPFIKTGGLADVCGALPKEFDKNEWDVRVVIPNYSCIPDKFRSKFEYVAHFYMSAGSYITNKYVGILKYVMDGITYYFIDNQEYFNCAVPYGDVRYDIEKFCFFDKAVLSMLKQIDFCPDIIHCHDWQTGLIPVYLKNEFQADSFYWGMKSIMTIHNLKFQGVWDIKTMQGLTGFSASLFTPDKLEAYKDGNFLKGGIVFADAVTTVSNTYADEIKTPFYGEGLDGLLRARSNSLRGIVNGIDYNDFNPETDINLSARYNATTFRKEKVKNKIQLQKDLGLEQDPKAMMIGIVSRLTDQKGFDLIAYIMDELCQDSVQIVALGTGDERYENMFRHFDWKYHGKVSAQIYYDESMSHRIYAASDAFLMPSLFEPYNEFEGTGTGFSFSNYNAHEMLSTIRYAEHIYYDKKREWNKMVDRAMAKDFSWSNSARQYEEMYNWLIGE